MAATLGTPSHQVQRFFQTDFYQPVSSSSIEPVVAAAESAYSIILAPKARLPGLVLNIVGD